MTDDDPLMASAEELAALARRIVAESLAERRELIRQWSSARWPARVLAIAGILQKYPDLVSPVIELIDKQLSAIVTALAAKATEASATESL